MKGLIFLTLFFGATYGIKTKSVDSQLFGEDAIVTYASKSNRAKRSIGNFYNINYEGYEAVVLSSSCKTTRGRVGSCMKLEECYPFLFPLNKTAVISTPTLNNELTNILIQASGICDMPMEYGKEYENFNQVVRSEFLICCPDPMTHPPSSNIPPKGEAIPTINFSSESEVFKGQRSCGQAQVQTSEGEGNDTMGGRVVGGRQAKPYEFPWTVALMNRGRQFCGGSLISSEWVITAAHCIQHMGASDVANLRILIGDHDIYNANDVPSQSRGVVKVLYHKGFNMQHLRDDIGLLKLSSPVQFTKGIQPICLNQGTSSIDGKSADISGWGQLCEGCQQPSKLMTASVKIISHSECKAKYASIISITDGMLCAGGDGKDSCRGDSGGPLSISSKQNAELVGLVSFGVECGSTPGVYTRISAYLDWIERNTKVRKMSRP